MDLSRRTLVLGGAAALATPQRPSRLRAGCQANGWNLDPAKFDLLLTAVREMKELGFEATGPSRKTMKEVFGV